MELWAAGLGDAHRERATKLAAFLRRRILSRPDGTVDWAYRPPLLEPFDQSGSEDISHAGVNVDFMALCVREGILFTRAELERVAETFLRVVRLPDGRFSDNVNGTGDTNAYADVIALWGRLAVVRPEVADVIEAHARRREPPMAAPFSLLTLAMLAHLGR
ncbi:MAG: hypothetical protein NTW19_10775 [Planctomycetota bacterium]|nr:hypothetical protein [Planctomycetota bacterium]